MRILDGEQQPFSKDGVETEVYRGDGTTGRVIIPPWHNGEPFFSLYLWLLRRKDVPYIAFRYPASILSPECEKTHDNVHALVERIEEELDEAAEEYGFDRFRMEGTSLSCVPALMVANGDDRFDEIKLTVPGNCLAESLWKGVRTQRLRRSYENQVDGLLELKRLWADLAPENHVDGLDDVTVHVTLSKADRVIPYHCGRNLVDALESYGVDYTLQENRCLGHYLTALKEFMRLEEKAL